MLDHGQKFHQVVLTTEFDETSFEEDEEMMRSPT